MARLFWLAAGAVLLGACGANDVGEPAVAPQCTLPDCDSVRPLGAMGYPLRAVGTQGVLTWKPDAEGVGELWHHALDGTARQISAHATANAEVDPQGLGVLYLAPTDTVPTAPAEHIGALLHAPGELREPSTELAHREIVRRHEARLGTA